MYGPERTWLAPPGQLAQDSALAGIPVPYSADQELFGPDDLAYVLFTSGSTGKPKGVMVSHANITGAARLGREVLRDHSVRRERDNLLAELRPVLSGNLAAALGRRHRARHSAPLALALGQLTRPVSFIAAHADRGQRTAPGRAAARAQARVSRRRESLAPDVAHRILSSGRVGTLLNTYGPTECTIAVAATEVSIPVPDVVPIGRQTPGTEVLILDEDGKQLPDGETGEICLFGRQVARGYVNDPERTEQRFRQGPADAAEPRRYYRTGDLGYRTADGMLYFRGRADRQVKINGIRIELEEIDTALRSHPQVSDAATIVQERERAVAYVVPAKPGGDVDFADLKNHVARALPPFMVPAGIVVVPELPTTVNGKLDTAALPKWIPGRQEEAAPAEDLDEVTARVIEIAADITGFKGQVKPSDDFMTDLGGTSLGIVRVLVELERYSGRRLRIGDALTDTTVAGLCQPAAQGGRLSG